MNFIDSVTNCFSNFANFKGRATPSEFWWFFLFQMLLAIVLGLFSSTLANLTLLVLMIPNLAVGARRLHDTNMSGWWQLIAISGIGAVILLFLFARPTNENALSYD